MLDNIFLLSLSDFFKMIQKEIKYGFIDITGQKHFEDEFHLLDLDALYHLQTPQELVHSKCGWCFDVVELIRAYMEFNQYEVETYFIDYKNDDFYQTHTFAIAKYNDSWYECIDNSYPENIEPICFKEKDELITYLCEQFKGYIQTTQKPINELGFSIKQFKKPFFNDKINYIEQIKRQ